MAQGTRNGALSSGNDSRAAISMLFGPQGVVTQKSLLEIRDFLQGSSLLDFLSKTIEELPKVWPVLVGVWPDLEKVPAKKRMDELLHFFEGGPPPTFSESTNNILLSPLAVISQIVEFYKLSHDDDNQRSEGFEFQDVQGFCVGFLTATVISCSKNEAQFKAVASKAVRLAFAIGALVDLDTISGQNDCASAVAIRWKSKPQAQFLRDTMRQYPRTYISVVTDAKTATITVPESEVSSFISDLAKSNLLCMPLATRGRWHHQDHSPGFNALLELCKLDERFKLPDASALNRTLISSIDGKPIIQGSLSSIAIKSILIAQSRWDLMFNTFLETTSRDIDFRYITIGEKVIVPKIVPNSSDARVSYAVSNGDSVSSLKTAQVLPDVPAYEESSLIPDTAVAIIGMACRYPDADTVEEFWELIHAGKCAVRPLPEDRYKVSSLTREPKGPFWGGFVAQPDVFDHRFFGISGREAKSMDPQQRMCLQVAYEAVESAGYAGLRSDEFDRDIGCYIGVANEDYGDNVASHPVNAFSATGTLRAFISGRISHHFGWTGPSVVLDTACSSGAVAIHTACKALQTRDCSVAVAGGVCAMTSSRMTQNLFGAGFLSPTGPSKAFDASADGYCRGEGAGLVVLKPMKDAIRSGDFILGVITGSAVNQGSNCSSITVPDSQSQRSLYHKALAVSGTAPMDVSYVEAHGTGTQVGDPIEFKSIRETFGSPDRKDEVFVGSVKDNIGHIEASSGVAGLLKTLLMMQKHTIPKQANFTRLNPKIEPLGKDRVLIPTQSTDWKAAKRIALINNYGASGNNAAMVVEEATPESCAHDSTLLPQSSHFPFFISGKTIEQVQSYGECLKSFLGKETTTSLADIAYNLAIKQNRDFDNSVVFTSSSISDLKAQLEQAASDNTKLLKITKHKSSVVLCFGGQNGALAQISKDLYDNCILLKHYIDECDVVCTEVLSLPSLFPLVFDTEPIEDITTLHCILFSIQYACAKAWLDCGLRVERMIGHSFGQLTALCVADSLSLADALRLVSTRSRLLDQYCSSEKGLMLVVEGEDSKQLLQLAQQQCQNFAADIACYNGPRSIVVAGTEESIASIENVSQRLPNSFRLIRLSNSHAYHSRLLDGILPGLTEAASTLDFATPKIPIEACSNEDDWSVITAEKITRHSRRAVYFMDAVRRVEQQVSKPVIWLEAGSGSPIIPMVKRAVNSTSSNHHVYIATPLQTSDAQLKLAKATSQLWSNGVRAQFWPFHRTQRSWYNWVNLPPYQFAKTSHWLEYKPAPAVQEKRTIEAEPPSSDLIQHLPSETRQGEAVFEINPRHEIYQLGTEGHKVVDLCLVPASLYTEFVISASRILISTQTAAAPCIRNLEMSSPLGLNPTGRVFLRLVEDKSKAEAWDFSVFSQDQQAGNAHPVIHATGHLAHSSDTSTLAHFDSLKGIILGRCHDIESSPSSIGFKGPTVYQAMHRVVIYADFYHGIRSIYTMGKEAVAYITLPPLRPSNMGSNFCDQVLADSFNQVSGVLANCFSGYGEGEMLICNSMGEIKFTPKFVENGRKDLTWIVYSKYHWTSPKRLSCDTFIFEQDSGELVSIVMATEFQKVSTKSLTKILSRLNATKPSQNAPRYNPAHTEMDPSIYQIQPPAVQQPQIKEHEPIKTTVTANDYQESIQEIKKVLGHILEIPLTEIAPDSVLEDLGIDSLLVTEIFAEMNTRFKISTTQSDVANITDVRGLAELLTPNMISTPRQPSIPASVPVQTVACSTPIITQQYNSNIHGSKQPNMREELPNGLSESSNESGTLQKVKNMLRDILEISLDEIMPESGLEELGIDSLLITEIFAEIKERFNVSVAQADFVAITDVQGLAQLVSSRLNAGSTATATPIFTPQFSASSGPMEMETIVYGERDGVLLSAEIHYPSEVRSIQNAHPVALMIHGGGHVMFGRKDIRLDQTQILLKAGFLPISIDYRLCPEMTLLEGPMQDVCDALYWARKVLPTLTLGRSDIRADGDKVAVVGWSTGGHLAMTLGWTAARLGIKAPDAVLAFYCPTDYEDAFWSRQNLPFNQKAIPLSHGGYDHLYDGIQDKPIVAYNPQASKRALGGWMSIDDPRSRIILHMSWEAATLPILINGLRRDSTSKSVSRPAKPSIQQIQSISPLAQIRAGRYKTPTFIIHGTRDDLIPWQQARRTFEGLIENDVPAGMVILEDAPHLFDMFQGFKSNAEAVKAVDDGFDFLSEYVICA